MTQATPAIELIGVKDVEKCKRITAAWLGSGDALAIDAEGSNVGATRRLTLLQVATRDGRVTIVDVINPSSFEDRQAGRRLLVDGGLKAVLESSNMLKISHGCQWDCGALFSQFDITAQNLFDTQAAHLAIEYAKGTRFSFKLKLEVLAEKYVDIALDSKDFKEEWMKDRLMFWGRRPLTLEAMEYAAGDVRILHQLYDVMKSKMSELEECQKHYELFLDIEMNQQREETRITEKSNTFKQQSMEKVFEEVQTKSDTSSLLSTDEKGAIRTFRELLSKGLVKESDLPPHMQQLEKSLVQEFENDLAAFQSGTKADFDEIDWMSMSAMNNHPNADWNERIKKVHLQLKKLRAKSETEKLQVRIQQGTIETLDDLKASEFETLNLYREFRNELTTTPMIPRLETDLSKRVLSQWETLEATGQLVYAVSPRINAIIRNLSRHPNHDIQTRAQRLNKVVTILRTQNEIKALISKYPSPPVYWANLNNNEKWTVKNYRQFKKSLGEEDHHRSILALEQELNRADLDQFEQWQRSGRLSAKAGRVEKGIIKTLTEHDDAGVRRRAAALNSALRQQLRSGNVRGSRW